MTSAALQQHLRVSASHDAWELLPHVVSPALVLHDTGDQMTPTSNADLIASRIPDALLELYDGGRHGFVDELADEVGARVSRFLLSDRV